MKRAGMALCAVFFIVVFFLELYMNLGVYPLYLIQIVLVVPICMLVYSQAKELRKGTRISVIDFFKGQNGQVSIEIVIVTGAIFLIVISVLPYITDENTVNKGVSAARDGATFARTMLNMGYIAPTAAGNVSLPRGDKVSIDDISYSVDTTSTPGTKIVRITLTISGTSDTDVADEIVSQAGNSIYYAYSGRWNTSTSGTVYAGDYRFIVNYQFA